MAYKMVVDYFKQPKYILLGHSLGAGIGNIFSRLYPEYVEKIIEIDTFTPYIRVEDFKDNLKILFNFSTTIHQKSVNENRRTYTEKDAVEKIRLGRWGTPLTVEAATSLVRRMLEPAGKCFFSYIN